MEKKTVTNPSLSKPPKGSPTSSTPSNSTLRDEIWRDVDYSQEAQEARYQKYPGLRPTPEDFARTAYLLSPEGLAKSLKEKPRPMGPPKDDWE